MPSSSIDSVTASESVENQRCRGLVRLLNSSMYGGLLILGFFKSIAVVSWASHFCYFIFLIFSSVLFCFSSSLRSTDPTQKNFKKKEKSEFLLLAPR
jgi:hypothetical protein